jgi:hypothetical protein
MRFLKFFFVFTICSFIFFSCQEEKEKFEPQKKQGGLELFFTHTINNAAVLFNERTYTNTAGNQYQVNEIKYFISKITLTDLEEKSVIITQDAGIHYVDCSLEKTLKWNIYSIPLGRYKAVSFVFGLDENDNQSNRFVNPPECNFSWPESLGGGYHYMQINGKFRNNEGDLQNMNIHTGIGQIYDENNNVKEFVQNYFTVTIPIHCSVYADYSSHITLNMEIQRWFDTPNLYNFDDFGTGIMQNQKAQELLKENGGNVFTMKHPYTHTPINL